MPDTFAIAIDIDTYETVEGLIDEGCRQHRLTTDTTNKQAEMLFGVLYAQAIIACHRAREDKQ